MSAIQDAVEAEFPAVGNVYTNRHGQLAIHGRFARFDPEGHSGPGTGWDFRNFTAGDGAAVAADPTNVAHIRAFSMARDLTKVINYASASPKGIADSDVAGQLVKAPGSIAKFGIRSWSSEGLLTKAGATTGNNALEETKTFATYYRDNYKTPQNRVTTITFRSMQKFKHHEEPRPEAAPTWNLLARCDIGDRVYVSIGSPGGGGLDAEPMFIEGTHEEVKPLSGNMDDVTLTLDLSPASYYLDNPYT